MSEHYDFLIVGAGPAGLTLATLLSDKYKILILEKNNYLGGNNGVIRGENNAFMEHSCRISSSAYLNFKSILNKMNLNFYDLFTYYRLPAFDTVPFIYHLSPTTLIKFTIAFIIFLFNPKYGNDIPLVDISNGSDKEINFLWKLCSMIDGGTVYNSRLNQILQVSNQNMLYRFYQPKETTDTGLFKLWSDYLTNKGVEIRLNEEINDINSIQYSYDKLILAMPPNALAKLIPDYLQFAQETKYSTYIPITFHWLNKHDITDPNDYSMDDKWGLISVITSNYTQDPISPYKTVISSVISYQNTIGLDGKTANESTQEEIKEYAYNQLKLTIKGLDNIPIPDLTLINNNYDGAYFNAINTEPISFETPYSDVYCLGTYNGKSYYNFTSLESACINAIALANNFGIEHNIKQAYTLRQIIAIIILLLFYLWLGPGFILIIILFILLIIKGPGWI